MDLMLKRNHIAHLEQVVMFDKFMVDFLLTDYPIVIQCDGAYWHNRPKVKSRDKGQDAYLVKAGYTVLRFDERQILHSPRECIKSIKSAIKTPSQPRLIHY
jgi:very-short-patch-repair endonuclease